VDNAGAKVGGRGAFVILSNCASMPYREEPVIQRQLVNEQHYNPHLDLANFESQFDPLSVDPGFPV